MEFNPTRTAAQNKSSENHWCRYGWFTGCCFPPVYILRPSAWVRDFCLPPFSSHFFLSCLLCTSRGLSRLSVSSWWTLPSSHYCLICAKRPAHKRPAGRPNFGFPHAAQRDSIEHKQGSRALGGVRRREGDFKRAPRYRPFPRSEANPPPEVPVSVPIL